MRSQYAEEYVKDDQRTPARRERRCCALQDPEGLGAFTSPHFSQS